MPQQFGDHVKLIRRSDSEPGVVDDVTESPPQAIEVAQWSSIELTPVNSKEALIWRPGMRVLKVELSVPHPFAIAIANGELLGRARIGPADHHLSAFAIRNLLSASQGLIVPLWADLPPPGREADHLALRRLDLGLAGLARAFLEFEDEIGDNIARHVWDSGIVALAVLANLCARVPHSNPTLSMPRLRDVLLQAGKLHVLEVGCGIGTVGIGVATLLQACADNQLPDAFILLTDLPDAEERAVANIVRFQKSAAGRGTGAKIRLEYDNLDWEDGRNGVFPAKVESTPWDLVILSDCTYNTDTLPALVQTLSALEGLAGQSGIGQSAHSGPKALVVTKERHSSEKYFFELMTRAGWTVLESLSLPLPVLVAASESIELYLFGKG